MPDIFFISKLPTMFPFRVRNAEDNDVPAFAAMEKFALKVHRFICNSSLQIPPRCKDSFMV